MSTPIGRKLLLIVAPLLISSACRALFNEIPQSTTTPVSTSATVEATGSPLPDPSPTMTNQPTPNSSPAAAITPSPNPTLSNPHAVVGVEANDVLNIREGAGTGYNIIGKIPPHGVNVERIGEGKEINSATWIPIRYQNLQGWVNDHYLAKQFGEPDPLLLEKSNQIVNALGNKNFGTLANFVHPQKCLRFSPYPTVLAEHQVFCPPEINQLFSNQDTYLWGQYDGSGKSIEMPFSDYYDEFVYDVNFAHAEMIGFNQAIGSGNAINNIHDFYPGSTFVEYHFPGIDPQYAGMDWRSLRLVFEKHDQEWFLVGIVHGEWTI